MADETKKKLTDATAEAAAKKSAKQAEGGAPETGTAADGSAEKTVKASKNDPFEALAKKYAKLYPDNKVFHITEDKQVFLEDHERDARMHQRSLKTGEVHSIKVK